MLPVLHHLPELAQTHVHFIFCHPFLLWAGCGALLAILAGTEDTNLIKRSDPKTHQRLQREIQEFLAPEPYPDAAVLARLDDRFIEKNLSPGGSADLLAATYFLYFLSSLTNCR